MIAAQFDVDAISYVYNMIFKYTLSGLAMRTNIVIDDALMEEALKVSRLKTKKDAVEEGLRLLIQQKKQENIKNLRGKLHWQGDLEELRTDEK